MALPSSGSLSLNQIHIEAGGSSGTLCSLNDADIRGIINKSANTLNAFSEYRGQSAETLLTSAGNINGQPQRKEISVSSFISSGETFRIPSNMWVWSDNTSVAALTIDIPCTVINDGKIIGKGGNGGWGFASPLNGSAGGPAINVTSSGVTITNSSGAYIAGGGGGGGSYSDYSNPSDAHAGGGGGAGGGVGGRGRINQGFWQQGQGGALNAEGTDGGNGGNANNPVDNGGGAGGAGGGHQYGGGGGGRILPGVGGGGGNSAGDGGSAGNAGVSGGPYVYSVAGGGGGWGAAGGTGGARFAGGAGGAAIQGTSRTLNNSGTIYGST
tara:strand:- start:2538 stop:3515 length:978 start_codon:yes stop_codon:yes gene_type:complete